MMKIMFLGGPLDYTTREVQESAHNPERPRNEYYVCPVVRPVFDPDPSPRGEILTYELHKVHAGDERAWFCYVLVGHRPSPAALLDTCPYPL